MSVFNEPTETNNEPTNPFEELVGEGKKFKDAEALAKGKLESDRYIQNLERQLAELREDLAKGDKVEELLELVRSQRDQATQQNSPNSGTEDGKGDGKNPNGTSSDLTEERLEALIESHLTKQETTNKRRTNLQEVDRVLEEKLGDKAAKYVKDKADELGMTVKELEDLAGRNPTAFFRLTGITNLPKNQSTMVGGRSSEGEARARGEVRNFAYYQNMRRTDRKKYYSPAVQHQMYLDAKDMGPSFYED